MVELGITGRLSGRLEGFLLIMSSPKNYHAVFNRYLSWKKITKILFS